jgi:hypothetical protein
MAGARRLLAAAGIVWAIAAWPSSIPRAQETTPVQGTVHPSHPPGTFPSARECMACHNGMSSPDGEDVSIGIAWRASMMANASRDPYWQASVRRETIDHPTQKAAIETECAVCHRPTGETAEGVSCTVCHQIAPDRLGTPESFVGRFVVAPPGQDGARRMFGPFEVEHGRAALMRSATGVTPAEATHVRQSELCATCHTLITQAFGPGGDVVGSIPEQVPFQEWQHSAYRGERSCQSCHMPPVAAPTRITSVLGEPRDDLGRHTFLGGNFFMLRMLNRYRNELNVAALPQELDASAHGTLRQLQGDTASIAIDDGVVSDGKGARDRLQFVVSVRNLTGHKFPTGYPSRRAWLHVVVRDEAGGVVFESGAIATTGAIIGNDNDDDPRRLEPHYMAITAADQVQIYESMMGDPQGRVTTGLLQATQFLKDNRLLPRGFDKGTAAADIAVFGGARADDDFGGDGDRVRYAIDPGNHAGPYDVTAELLYQPIGFRWATNLKGYDAPEPRRFTAFYDAMAAGSSVLVTRANARVR